MKKIITWLRMKPRIALLPDPLKEAVEQGKAFTSGKPVRWKPPRDPPIRLRSLIYLAALAVVSAGCATDNNSTLRSLERMQAQVEETRNALTGPTTRSIRELHERMDEAKRLLMAQGDVAELLRNNNSVIRSEVEHIRSELQELKTSLAASSKAATPTDNGNKVHLITYLRINDYLVENRESTIQEFQRNWSPHKDALFAALGGSGPPLDFEVDDAFLYKGYLVVTALYLWSNADGSGGVLRGAVWMDPDKEFDISNLSILGQSALSREQMASLAGDARSSETEPARTQQLEVQATASGVQSRPEKAEKAWISDETKNKLLRSGIAVGAAWLMKQILSDQ